MAVKALDLFPFDPLDFQADDVACLRLFNLDSELSAALSLDSVLSAALSLR